MREEKAPLLRALIAASEDAEKEFLGPQLQVQCGVVWCGMVRRGVVWCGVVWCIVLYVQDVMYCNVL
jgi:hypothetical protein